MRHRGATLLEVMVAFAILAIATTGVLMSILSNSRLSKSNREFLAAAEASQRILQDMQNTGEFKDIFRRYNSSLTDDLPDGNNPSDRFDVDPLRPLAGEVHTGFISFPVIEAQLREDSVDAELGLPLDLNGDGKIDAHDHSHDYAILPVTVRVRWCGTDGSNQEYVVRMLLTAR